MNKPMQKMRVGWLSRRTLLRTCIYSGMASFLAYGYAAAEELEEIQVDVPIRGLAPDLDGFTIGVLSDFHAGAYLRPKQIEQAVATVNAYRPDVIALVGDFVDGKTESHNLVDLEDSRFLFATLRNLRANQGIYAVLGNHDHWANAAWVSRELTGMGARILANENIRLDNDLVIAGVDDHWVGRAQLKRTLKGVPAAATTVLLSHNPDINRRISADNSIKLVLSGHTHGGQVRMPFSDKAFWVPCTKKYRNQSGLIRETDDRWTFITKGIGTYLAPIRWNCPPDIGILTLRRA